MPTAPSPAPVPASGHGSSWWAPVWLALVPRAQWPGVVVDLLGVVFYGTNWLISYAGRGRGPLSHTWSLSTEESSTCSGP